MTVYRPIEEYWESFCTPTGSRGPEPSEAIDPLDVFLVHRLLDLAPSRPLLIDATTASTAGASSLIGLAHPHVRGIWTVAEQGSLVSTVLASLRGYLRSKESGFRALQVVARCELLASMAEQRPEP